MSKKLLFVASLVVLLGLTNNILATNIEWLGDSGIDFLWSNNDNWLGFAQPTAIQDALIDVPDVNKPCVIDSTVTAVAHTVYVGFYQLGCYLNMTGGTLTANRLQVGSAVGSGTVTISDGNMSLAGDSSVGQGFGCVGTLNINGGSIYQASGWFYAGYQGGIGTINLNGGILSTPNLQLGTVEGAAYAPVPLVDLRGGTLEIRNPDLAAVEFQMLAFYAPRGWVKAYGGAGTISVTQDPETTWAIVKGVPPCWWDLPGDVNHDCTVNLADFSMLADDWLVTVP